VGLRGPHRPGGLSAAEQPVLGDWPRVVRKDQAFLPRRAVAV